MVITGFEARFRRSEDRGEVEVLAPATAPAGAFIAWHGPGGWLGVSMGDGQYRREFSAGKVQHAFHLAGRSSSPQHWTELPWDVPDGCWLEFALSEPDPGNWVSPSGIRVTEGAALLGEILALCALGTPRGWLGRKALEEPAEGT